ncbi:unnamed protein product [Musa acuminata subsp. malaccensis]|uniref:(wild Malaysian banana) hypothetical protein n=1 Tax=Musa acuminata subsp. malaccensis TaxID=214687 RepID=A0A804J9U9_MUSAM|nr:unnamed protein product [Musa acuminata subsp. malaccensis]
MQLILGLMKFVELLHISIVFPRPSIFQCIKKMILSPQEIRSRISKLNFRRLLHVIFIKDSSTPKLRALTTDASLSKAAITKVSPLDELKETMKLGDDSRRAPAEGDSKEETKVMPKIDSNSDSNTDKIHERDRERTKTRDHDSRGRDSGYDGRVQESRTLTVIGNERRI